MKLKNDHFFKVFLNYLPYYYLIDNELLLIVIFFLLYKPLSLQLNSEFMIQSLVLYWYNKKGIDLYI